VEANRPMILAGDIGGTSTRLALFEVRDNALRAVAERTYSSREHAGLQEIVKTFVDEHRPTVDHASFGIAGPKVDGHINTSNLPWVVEAQELANELGLAAVGLLNDLEANAYGIAALPASDLLTLNVGVPRAVGNAAVIAAGTGLGEAGLYWDGTRHHPFGTEGGHTDFAPRNALEIELLDYLLQIYEHVSYERVLSGPGLYNIYVFLRETGRAEECAAVVDEMLTRDPTAVISEAGLTGICELCVRALDLFVSIYGAAAGNLALKIMARAGIYIGGGIAPKIVAKLKGQAFMDAFTAKGRLKPVCESIPVRIILNPKTALLGTARYAALQAQLLN
jgi:glucokinase